MNGLGEVLNSVRSYLDLEDGEEAFIIGALAVAVSKALVAEEPLWLFLIGPPGAGKTEAIRLLDLVADQRVDELTRAGLLSWSPGTKTRRVGLLTRIPPMALVTISDFSTVATMGDREARARMSTGPGGGGYAAKGRGDKGFPNRTIRDIVAGFAFLALPTWLRGDGASRNRTSRDRLFRDPRPGRPGLSKQAAMGLTGHLSNPDIQAFLQSLTTS